MFTTKLSITDLEVDQKTLDVYLYDNGRGIAGVASSGPSSLWLAAKGKPLSKIDLGGLEPTSMGLDSAGGFLYFSAGKTPQNLSIYRKHLVSGKIEILNQLKSFAIYQSVRAFKIDQDSRKITALIQNGSRTYLIFASLDDPNLTPYFIYLGTNIIPRDKYNIPDCDYDISGSHLYIEGGQRSYIAKFSMESAKELTTAGMNSYNGAVLITRVVDYLPNSVLKGHFVDKSSGVLYYSRYHIMAVGAPTSPIRYSFGQMPISGVATKTDYDVAIPTKYLPWAARFVLPSACQPDLDLMKHHNTKKPTDVNGDGKTTPVDGLIVGNELARLTKATQLTPKAQPNCLFYDVNNDGWITPNDAIRAFNAVEGPS